MRKISELLKDEREKQGLKLEDIARSTRIKKGYLVAIEEGRFHDLPSEAYALGFVKNYAGFLKFPLNHASALFRREYEAEYREIVPNFRKQDTFVRKDLISSKFLPLIIISIVLCGYIFFQYGTVFLNPKLTVTSPKNNEVIDESVIHVNGVTDQYATITINGDEVSVGLDGSFKKSLFVFPGEQKITIIAKSRFGKQTQKIIPVKVK